MKHVASIKKSVNKKQKISLIVLSSDISNRMKSYGPKSLIKIDDKTILEHQIEIVAECFPTFETILICGFEADKLMNNAPSGVVKVENERYETTNNIKNIGMALRACTSDRALIVHGDIIFNKETISENDFDNSFLTIEKDEQIQDSIGCNIIDGYIEHMMYQLPNRWTNIAYLTGKELKYMKQIAWNREKENLFTFEAINDIINKGGKFLASSPVGMETVEVNCLKNLNAARLIV